MNLVGLYVFRVEIELDYGYVPPPTVFKSINSVEPKYQRPVAFRHTRIFDLLILQLTDYNFFLVMRVILLFVTCSV